MRVASVDEQHFVARGDPAAALLDLQSATGALCVDHGDAARADRDVVDVRPSAVGDPAVVQQHDVVALEVFGELVGDADLCVGALLPRVGALRVSGQPREGLAERS